MIILNEMIQPAFQLFFDKSGAHLPPLNCDLVTVGTEGIIPNKYEN